MTIELSLSFTKACQLMSLLPSVYFFSTAWSSPSCVVWREPGLVYQLGIRNEVAAEFLNSHRFTTFTELWMWRLCFFWKWANLTSTDKSHIWPYLVITWGPLIGTAYWQAGSGWIYSFHIYLPYHHYKVNSRCESKGALLCVYRRGTDGLAGLPHVSVSPRKNKQLSTWM